MSDRTPKTPHTLDEWVEADRLRTVRASVPTSTDGRAILAQVPELHPGPPEMTDRWLGSGGMADVRVGIQRTLGREVAVKTVRPDTDSPHARVRLLREAWVAGQLEHPHIVPVYDLCVGDDGAPQVLLKRIDGEVWSTLVHQPVIVRQRFGARDVLAWHVRVLQAVCLALAYAHEHRVLHRDLKPSNVMVGSFGEVTLLDWGVAVSLDPDPTGRLPVLTPTSGFAGTPAYAAPEMLHGTADAQGPHTDVFLVGATLFHVLAGAPPFAHDPSDGGASGIDDLVFPDEAPPSLVALCRDAMAPEPADRPGSMREVHRRLQAFLDDRALDALVTAAETHREALTDALTADDEEAFLGALATCRFAYGHVLAQDPEHPTARAALDEALADAAGWALERDRAPLARTLVAEIGAEVPELRARVEAATAARASRDAELARIAADVDAGAGVRTRAWVVAGSAVVAVFVATVLRYVRGPSSYTHHVALNTVIAVLVVLLIRGAWPRIRSTLHNRVAALTFVAFPFVQLVITAGGWLQGWTIEGAQTVMMISGVWLALNATFLLGARFLPGVVIYVVAWFAASAWPTHVEGIGGLAHITFLLWTTRAWLQLARTG